MTGVQTCALPISGKDRVTKLQFKSLYTGAVNTYNTTVTQPFFTPTLTITNPKAIVLEKPALSSSNLFEVKHNANLIATISYSGTSSGWLEFIGTATHNTTNGVMHTITATELRVRAKSENTLSEQRNATITYTVIQPGTPDKPITKTITVGQVGGPPPADYSTKPAICYIALPGQTIKFNAKIIGTKPTSAAMDVFNPRITGKSYYGTEQGNNITINPRSVALKWQTAHGRINTTDKGKMLITPSGIKYNTSTGVCTVTITNPSGAMGGSAYLCAYSGDNGSGDILWSWHIWVTNDDVTNTNTHITTALSDRMMDRALGAISKTAGINSFGMLYQWGRKDPFTPPTTTGDATSKDTQLYNASGTAINTNSGGLGGVFTAQSAAAPDITTLTKNPSIYYGIADPYIPIVNAGPTDLTKDWWNPEIKTLYDPCPYGYRIPKSGTYGADSEWIKLT